MVVVSKLCLTFGTPWTIAHQTSVCEILQARIQEWIAMPFSRGSSRPRDRTHVSCVGRQVLYPWATGGAHIFH